MKKTDIETLLLATPMQESMVFTSLAQPNTGHYILQLGFELHGDHQHSLIREAWQVLLQRHAALRTQFVWKRQEKLRQLVRKTVASEPQTVNLSALPPTQQDAEYRRILEDDKARGFALGVAPLTRLTVLQLSADTKRCIWAFHHGIVDGWSIAILFREFCAIYAALASGEAPPQKPPSITLENLVDHIRDSSAAARGFWAQQLRDEQNHHPLAAVEAPSASKQQHCIHESRLSAAVSGRIYAGCRARHITFASLALAGWGLMLAYCSGRDSVMFGSVSSGRGPLGEHGAHSIGLHISLQPVRVAVDMTVHAGQFLADFQRLNALCGEHEHLAPAALAELLQTEPGAALFDSMLVVENHPGAEQLTEDMLATGVRNVQGYEQSDTPLAVSLGSDESIIAVSRFHADRFNAANIASLIDLYFDLLARLATAAEPAVLKDLLPALSMPPNELSAAHGDADSESPARLVQLFNRQVEHSPNKTALYFQDQVISYASLADHAEAIRLILLERGVASGDIVAVNMQRSPACVASMLAILALDACYLPLDPAYPLQRLKFMLRDSGSKLVLCIDDIRAWEFAHVAIAVPQAGSSGPLARLKLDAAFGNPAMCLIYTSGSTGQPKGVKLRHDSMLNRCRWMWQAYPFADEEVCCQRTPLGFVDSVCEIFSPLCGGVPAVIISDDELRDLNGFVALLRRRQVSRITFVPGLLAAVLESLQESTVTLPALTLCCCSGEPLPTPLAATFRSVLPDCRLLNLYGSTEVAADALYYELPASGPPEQAIVPIGTPIAATQAQVVNAHRQPLPAGVLGELCIGGVAVADGYHQRGEETDARFIRQAGSIDYYLSGDLAVQDADGIFHYRGRIDRQLKVRGQRVEPGEIERLLCADSAINHAVALQLPDGRLVAGFTVSADTAVDTAALMASLQQSLPAFALPQALIQLDEIPLNASGKVDYAALQTLCGNGSTPQHAAVPEPASLPQQAVFSIIKNIWQELLPHAAVEAGDNFFQLGGQSLLAMRMIARVERSLRLEIPLPLLMNNPQLADFATAVGEGKRWSDDNQVLTLRAAKGKPGLFCVHGDAFNLAPHCRGEYALHWLSQWPRRMNLAKDKPRLPPVENIEEIAKNYLQQARAVQPAGPYCLLAGSAAAIIAIEMAQQLLAEGKPPATLLLMDLPQGELQPGPSAAPELRIRLAKPLQTANRLFGPSAIARQLNYLRARRKLIRGISLTDVEARDFTNGQLFQAVARYPIRPYPGKVVYIVSGYWARHASGEATPTVPDRWQKLLPNIASVQIAPAVVHNDLLQGESARFVAELCDAVMDPRQPAASAP